MLYQYSTIMINNINIPKRAMAATGDESLEDVSLPSGARALDLSFFADPVPWYFAGNVMKNPDVLRPKPHIFIIYQ